MWDLRQVFLLLLPLNFHTWIDFFSVFCATCFIRNYKSENCTLPFEQKIGGYSEFLIPAGFPQFELKMQFEKQKAFLTSIRRVDLSCHILGSLSSEPSINSLKCGHKSLVLFTLNQT